MPSPSNRHEELQRFMSYILIGNAVLFFLYLLCSGFGITWLKIILSIVVILVSLGCLALLFLSRELTRKRSLWMTSAAGCTLICLLFSLFLSFP